MKKEKKQKGKKTNWPRFVLQSARELIGELKEVSEQLSWKVKIVIILTTLLQLTLWLFILTATDNLK